jgi:dTDP-3-amino-2,3,6-trideoxy-4-keto-D-glucose/dTDP-3-amino-3,4,6-trideoxy-alpha-D-glucose/dTDP-2,6-dideoxy-D-kanosamine transaminase
MAYVSGLVSKFEVPLFDLSYSNSLIKEHIMDVMQRHIETSTFILGPDVKLFEDKFAGLVGCKHAVGVNSGTDALVISLKSFGVGPGDKVITVPNSYIATAQAICYIGATPIFVDVDDTTMNMDLSLVQAAIDKDTKAIIPVHLYGFPVDIPKLREIVGPDIPIIEDCAQSHGALVGDKLTGSMGDTGCFSLHPAKILSSLGDAGVITMNDVNVADKCLLYRNFGLEDRDSSVLMGYNSRLDNIYAAIMYKKIDLFDQMLEKRLENASVYYDEISSVEGVCLPPQEEGYKNVHNFFVIRVEKRDELKKFLEEKGVETKIHYPIPIHLQKSFSPFGHKRGDFPNTERQADTILTIPVAEHLSKEQIKMVADSIKRFLSQ